MILSAWALAGDGTVEVVVADLRSDAGYLGCKLFADAASFPSKPEAAVATVGEAIHGGRATCRFTGLDPGSYAFVVVHDENLNKQLDTTWYGMPVEGYGVSNDAVRRFGPPRWEDARFELGAGQTRRFELRLHY